MKDDEKQIQIRLQNDNCMIYLKGNESSMIDKNKKSLREEILYDDDMKELSLSISNISEFNSNKRKINLKNYSIDKTENEISELSIFNSNIKQEDINPKTPLFELKNESINNNNLRKEKNNQDFKEELKSKNLVIKKLNFDSAECDTIQETDTIKKLDSKEKINDNDKGNNSNNDNKNFSEEKININKNLHKQFFSKNEINKNDEEENIKIENIYLNETFKKEIQSNEDANDNVKLDMNSMDNTDNLSERKNEKEEPKINNSNINNIKNELISTTKYKQKCIEKYFIELKKSKSKTIIQNKIFDLKCRSFSRQKKENNKILYINPKQIKLKENILNAHIIESKDKKPLATNDGINNIIYIKNMKSKNSFYKKRSISNWSRTKTNNLIKTLNQENTTSKQPSYPIESTSFIGNKYLKNDINNKIYLSNLNNYIINNRNCEKAIFLTNNNYNTNLFCTCFSANNIFIKKNISDYNNYYNQISKSKKIIQVGDNYNKYN